MVRAFRHLRLWEEVGLFIFEESHSVRLLAHVEAHVVGESRKLLVYAGSVATVVLVHGDPSAPDAYELEFYLPEEDCYALATVEANQVARV